MSTPYIFINQTKLRIRLSTFLDLTDASSALIYYLKPSGIQGSWVATFETPRIGGVVFYDIVKAIPPAEEQINETGTWYFWVDISYIDGREAPTTAERVIVYPRGTVVEN